MRDLGAMMTTAHPSTLLKRSLIGNAWFSIITGLVLVGFSRPLAGLLGPPAWMLAAVGAGVLGFGILVGLGASRAPRTTGRVAVAADTGWVIATLALAPIVGHAFTAVGGWVALGVALIVADLAVAEWIGLRRMGGADGAT